MDQINFPIQSVPNSLLPCRIPTFKMQSHDMQNKISCLQIPLNQMEQEWNSSKKPNLQSYSSNLLD